MRTPYPLATMSGRVSLVEPVADRNGNVWAYAVGFATEPRGGNIRITARIDDLTPETVDALPSLIGHDVQVLVALSGRSAQVKGETRAYVQAAFGELLSVDGKVLTAA